MQFENDVYNKIYKSIINLHTVYAVLSCGRNSGFLILLLNNQVLKMTSNNIHK